MRNTRVGLYYRLARKFGFHKECEPRELISLHHTKTDLILNPI